MRFALLGDHPDGLNMACALVASGRHQLATYTGSPVGAERLRHSGLSFQNIPDIEEVLADPAVEAVIVASRLPDRPQQLRRALQSERHVLCVHPADQTPDMGYEAAMIQGDTHCVLLPLLPDGFHPGVLRLASLLRGDQGELSPPRLIQMECSSVESLLPGEAVPNGKPSLPGWDVLRIVAGEIAEVSAFAALEEVTFDEPLLVAGRFERGGLFQTAFVRRVPESHWRLKVIADKGQAELTLFSTLPIRLTWSDETGTAHEETWESWNPWPPLVDLFDAAVARSGRNGQKVFSSTVQTGAGTQASSESPLSWQTAVRCLELDDAVRRSVQRRRVSTLEYPEANEEVGFKGTMTLVGCGVLWVILLLFILSRWFPWLGWVIVPVLVFFLGLQLLRWLLPRSGQSTKGERRIPG